MADCVFSSRKLVARHRIVGAGVIKGLVFAMGGRTGLATELVGQAHYPPSHAPYLLSASRAELRHNRDRAGATHRFNDPISKVAVACPYRIVPDGSVLAGGAADPAAHKIYIWDISNDGQFASALDGGREPLLDVHQPKLTVGGSQKWHPHGPRLASTTKDGNILIWHCPSPERWGAFAGGFEEADRKCLEDEAELALRKKMQEDEDIDVIGGIEDSTFVAPINDIVPGDLDLEWADEEGELDREDWKMKIITVEGEEVY
ncbi:hypothetical protein EDC04DRAFT_3089593 [Pisolithus marmoratus]|nr:hypothetical protein EDC04DRAFT_3089593 [Pisolithus marmoratus]